MKLSEKVMGLYEAKSSKEYGHIRSIDITVERKMNKGFKAECKFTVSVDEKEKEAWLKKELASIEEEATSQGKRDEETDEKIKEAIDKWTKNFLKTSEKDIASELKKLSNQNVRVSKNGRISFDNSKEYSFIKCVLTCGGAVVSDAGEIDDWKYDGGEVVIHEESYGSN